MTRIIGNAGDDVLVYAPLGPLTFDELCRRDSGIVHIGAMTDFRLYLT
jgi:hypothetical protein